MPKVYIVLLNWNGWKDTVECLESVFRSNYDNYRVIVCDNDSSDGSIEHIKKWAEGYFELDPAISGSLKHLVHPPIPKPVDYIEYTREESEAGGDHEKEPRLILIRTGGNLGFAGGNNIGLRYALSRADFDYVWLLNNDTVIEPDSLGELITRIQSKPSAGVCGSTLLYYDAPDTVQALGGARYNRWFGTASHYGVFSKMSASIDADAIESKLSYIVGASALVSREFLTEVGLISEEFFLYSEEIDWITRAGDRFSIAYAPKSIVYHKEGGSMGSSSDPLSRTYKADYYGLRNRVLVARKHFPWTLPTVYFGLFISLLNRLRRRQWDRAMMILKIALHSGGN